MIGKHNMLERAGGFERHMKPLYYYSTLVNRQKVQHVVYITPAFLFNTHNGCYFRYIVILSSYI